MKVKHFLWSLFFLISFFYSCEPVEEDEGGIIIENQVSVLGSSLDIIVFIDNTDHGILRYGKNKTYSVDEGRHDLLFVAAPNQGTIWSVEGWFQVSGGGIAKIVVTQDGF